MIQLTKNEIRNIVKKHVRTNVRDEFLASYEPFIDDVTNYTYEHFDEVIDSHATPKNVHYHKHVDEPRVFKELTDLIVARSSVKDRKQHHHLTLLFIKSIQVFYYQKNGYENPGLHVVKLDLARDWPFFTIKGTKKDKIKRRF